MIFSSDCKCDFAVLVVGIVTLAYFLLKRKYSFWERHGFKTLPGTKFIFGHMKSLVRQKEAIGDIIHKLYNSTDEPFIGIYTLLRPSLLIRDPELARQILVKDFSYFPDRGLHSNEDYDPLSGNLVSLPGEKWKNLRGKLTPTFTSGKLKAMFSTLLNCGSTLQKYLDDLADKGEMLNVREISAAHATNVIASVAFGIDVDTINEPDNEFRVNGRKIFDTDLSTALRKILNVLSPKLLSLFRIKAFNPSVEPFIMSIVKQNLEYREKHNVVRKDFFQLLVQLRNSGSVQLDDQWDTVIKTDESQKKMSINEIAAQSFVFFAAGFETSSTTLSFCLYELARHPGIQQRAHNEIDQVLEKFGEISYESVSEMKYLEYCIEETLRKYPVVVSLPRNCARDYPIPGTNKVIPKDCQVLVPVFGFHRDEKYYESPEKFNPDRFNEENSVGKNHLNRPYYPFGDGPRNCIGMRMGKMQTKVGLVSMLQKCRFEMDDELKNRELTFDPKSLLLSPVGGINLKIFKR